MRELNIEFQEKYKLCDNYAKELLGAEEGISEYIKRLESAMSENIPDFSELKSLCSKLKKLRWIRNKLAHEVSIDEDICRREDIDRLNAFYDDLVSGNDLLSTLEIPEEQNDANGEPEKKDLGWLYWLIGMGICAFIIFLLLKAFL